MNSSRLRVSLVLGSWLSAGLIPTLAGERSADAFCGFYVGGAGAKLFNDATVVVMMREGTRTVLSMQNAYKGPPEKFAMVVPVPVVLQKENVKTLTRGVFDHIDALASPRLVEYWEVDPCFVEPPMEEAPAAAGMAIPSPEAAQRGGLGVKIEAQFTVGEYQIVILSAKDSGGLETWLRNEKYAIPDGAEPYLRPYVAAGEKFFVAKVDIQKVKMEKGVAVLSPLRFHYDAPEFKLPVRLGLINSGGTQDLIVHIISNTRFEVANYPNVTIPTNIDLAESAKSNFAPFYTTLFDQTLAKNPKAVITEYAWEPTSCDPCPGPALDMTDLATLGYDVLPSQQQASAERRAFMGTPPLVLTRLHARYAKNAVGDDLVFREAAPIVGGREMRGDKGQLEHGATKSSFNNFQARYAIRHPWTGPIACKEPIRGRWGGPPGGGEPPPVSAKQLGLAPRAEVNLATVVKSDITELGITAAAAPTAPVATPPPADGSGATPPPATKKGCFGCAMTDDRDTAPGALAAVGALALTFLRGRTRRRNLS